MAAELRVKWEGSSPGLPEHRLSIGAFGDPLNRLLTALRRIATNIVGDAIDGKRSDTGRFANAARQLDIEITGLIGGSTGFESVLTFATPAGENIPLFADLPERAGAALLDAIDLERQGIATSVRVRDYLRQLPIGVTRQTYLLHRNGTAIKEIAFGDADLLEMPADIPHLAQNTGRIVGVGFAPGRNEVRIRTEDGRTINWAATAQQTEKALSLRGAEIIALGVIEGSSLRLLILRSSTEPRLDSSRDVAVYQRWDGLLRRLAK
jgi:hypothetical protein